MDAAGGRVAWAGCGRLALALFPVVLAAGGGVPLLALAAAFAFAFSRASSLDLSISVLSGKIK